MAIKMMMKYFTLQNIQIYLDTNVTYFNTRF